MNIFRAGNPIFFSGSSEYTAGLMKPDHTPPGVYTYSDAPIKETSEGEPSIKPDFKDFVALTLAAYSIVLPHVLMVIGGVVIVFLALNFLFTR